MIFSRTHGGVKMLCICFADSAMIMHVVPKSAEVCSCGLRNILRVVIHIVCSSARVTDVPYIIIYRLRTFNSSKRGSLRLAPIMYVWSRPSIDHAHSS